MSLLKPRHSIDTHIIKLSFGELSIGRAPNNDVQITDPTVSSHHARIFTYLNSSYIEDLQSRNGTFLNGKRIDKHVLRPGDTVQLGNHILTVTAEI